MSRQALGTAEIDLHEETHPAVPALQPEGAEELGARANPLATLAAAPVGARVRIRYLGDGDMRAQAIRLGLGPGSEVTVWARLPRGPVLVSRGPQHIAVGYRLAGQIWVEILRSPVS
ncbi:MAG: ferrous iron transport protein A [Bacillota bacterium]|nr:ferrous iron transport protein A [Bacillota bacterium]MDI7248682.1 ferrous iron transport protein A [Bacillota bacterium]